MSLVFGASKNVSFNNNIHVSKLFAKGFENLPSSFFFRFRKSSIEYWAAHVAAFILRVWKFHPDIDNKMADNNGFVLLHQTDFDISNDRFCWNDIFIRWFEDYQLPTIAYGPNSFSSSLLHMLSCFEWEAPVLRGQLPSSHSFLKSSVLIWPWLKYRIFMYFSSQSHFLQVRCENLGS